MAQVAISQRDSKTPALPKHGSFYRPELDILRFTAFLLVFFAHLMPFSLLENFFGTSAGARLLVGLIRGGLYGVDLFFCLSSYLITTLLIKEHDLNQGIDVKAFYFRRILRIWPLYFTYLIVINSLIGLLLPDQLFPRGFFIAFVLLSGNWACAAWGFPSSAAGILWSVAIEEQFYLTWPLVMKRWLRHLPAICIGLLATAFLARGVLVYWGEPRDAIFGNTLTRLDPIVTGALVGFLLKGRTPRLIWPARAAMVILGILGIALCGGYGAGFGRAALWTYPCASLASVLLLLGTLGADLSLIPAWPRRALVYLGQISYGLYVFHRISIEIVARALGTHHALKSLAGQTALTMLLTVLLAVASYHWLEAPFLRLKRRFAHIVSTPAA